VIEAPEPLNAFPVAKIDNIVNTVNDAANSLDLSPLNLEQAIDNIVGVARQNPNYQTAMGAAVKSTITGSVWAPSGRLAFNKSFNLADIFIPPAEALSGLQAVGPGIKVSLYRIDDDGNFRGIELSTAQTSSDGKYVIVLPPNVTPASDLSVSVGTSNDKNLMRAHVYSYTGINIDPLSETCMKFVTDNGTLTGQNKVPLSKFSNEEIYKVLRSIDLAVLSVDVSKSNTINEAIQTIYNTARIDTTVKNMITFAAGIPAPVVDSIPRATTKETITVTGKAFAGSLIQITGGKATVQYQLPADTSNFSIDVPLQRNTKHTLYITATNGSDISLPATLTIRHDTINPVIDSTKITVATPNAITYKCEITGNKGAIVDAGATSVTITNTKIKTSSITVNANSEGAFLASVAADVGDILNFQAVDEAGNAGSLNIPVRNPGLAVTDVSPAFAANGNPITITGSGFDTTANYNTIIFDGPSASYSVAATSISPDGKALTAFVPGGISSILGNLPADVKVKVTNKNGTSNDNKKFKLIPAITKLNGTLTGDGQSQYLLFDYSRSVILGSSREGNKSRITRFDSSGNILTNEMTVSPLLFINNNQNISHYSIFIDMDIDRYGDIVVSNYDTGLLGETQTTPTKRPDYRISKYTYVSDYSKFATFSDLTEDLKDKPGSIAVKDDRIYVALPDIGKILRVLPASNTASYVTTFAEGIKTPIKDIMFDITKSTLFVSCGDSLSIYKISMDAGQESAGLVNHAIDNNFVNDIGTGSGRLAVDNYNNIYVAVGAGIDIITPAGERRNLVTTFSGQPVTGILIYGNTLYANELNGNLYRITP